MYYVAGIGSDLCGMLREYVLIYVLCCGNRF